VDVRAPVAGQPPVTAQAPVNAHEQRELIASVLRRDRKAAARFVAEHIDAVYGFARSRLLPRADLVDDVVQEVFLGALHGLATFQGHSSLRTWLLGIARHKIEDVYRHRLRASLPLDELNSPEDEPVSDVLPIDEEIDRTRASDKARRVLEQLPEQYGLLLSWRYWEQRSTRDMAAAIGATEKSVERTLARARARFKDIWLKESGHGR
jgi:RNA polymerase sigma-70 factor (ECF subfamily)